MEIGQPVLVTGATGFIGGRLVDRLIAGGLRPRLLVRGDTVRAHARWGDGVEVARGDVTDRDWLAAAVAGVRTVFHLAAVVGDAATQAEHRAVTVEGTRNLMAAAAMGRPHVVLVSTCSVYGAKARMNALDEDVPWGRPLGHYGAAKQAQERLAAKMAQAGSIPLTLVRPSHVYGPHSPQWVDAVVAELKRGTPVLVGGGDFNAGLCHVDNLVEALLLCASRSGAVGRAYNVSDGSEVTWKQYFGDLARMAGAPPPKGVPYALASALAVMVETPWRLLRLRGRPPLTREALNLLASGHRFPIARIRRELGFEPLIRYEQALPAIEAGLREGAA